MDCIIREMKESDWKSVSEIYNQGLISGYSTFQTVCPTYEEWDATHIDDCRFIAEIDGRVVGWCALSHTSAREVYRGVVEVSIYIDENFRKFGVGSKLLQKLCKEAEKSGYWTIYAAIFQKNIGSINLHKKCGFREIGYREKIAKDRFGEWQNTVLMEYRNNIR